MPTFKQLSLFVLASGLLFSSCRRDSDISEYNDLDRKLEEQLRIASAGQGKESFKMPDSDDFGAIPQDSRNPITTAKVKLGKLLFHETYLAQNPKLAVGEGTYSCASCHHAQGGFQAGMAQGIGEGGTGFGFAGEGRSLSPGYDPDSIDVQPVRTPSALNVAYQDVVLWSGALGATGINVGTDANWTTGTPKEDNHLGYSGPETQGIAGFKAHRLQVDEAWLASNAEYGQLFAEAFPHIPQINRITRENIGLALAAYERTLLANQAPFQRWLRGETVAMTDSEKEGALLFFGDAGCYNCHSGPALSDGKFHAIGMNDLDGPGVYGSDPDAKANAAKGRGGFTGNNSDMYAFKTPQLYNLKDSPFFGHGGNFTNVASVVRYKNGAIPQNTNVPHSYLDPDFRALQLSDLEVQQLTDFIENALYDPDLKRYVPSTIPSGQCFPNNDPASSAQLCGG